MPIYQFNVELQDYKPRMWRRILVKDDLTVAQLGYVTLGVFRSDCCHLMQIEKPACKSSIPQATYKIPNPYEDGIEDDDESFYDIIEANLGFRPQKENKFDAATELVKFAVSLNPGDDTLVVNYDFGDDWRFKLKLEKILDENEVKVEQIPCVIAGKGFGIIDDCGGVYGLMELAEAAKLMSGDAYERYCDWIDLERLDLSYFDKDELNEILLDELPLIQNVYESFEENVY